MLDMIKTLDPASGLTSNWRLARPAPPDQPFYSVVANIGTAPDNPLHLVGACGVSLADTLTRGAGEAVERFSLDPRHGPGPGTCTAVAADLDHSALDFAAACLGDEAAVHEPLTWYIGWSLTSGDPVRVPAALVDYPARNDAAGRWFDPTPSGAGAGGTLEFALRRALLEVIERDAVSVAWARQRPVTKLDLKTALAHVPENVATRQFARLLTIAHELGLAPALLDLPTAVAGVHCLLATVIDLHYGRTLAAVGVKATSDPSHALQIALQEAMKVRAVLIGLGGGSREPLDVVRTDIERAHLWNTEPAVATLLTWIERCPVQSWRPSRPAFEPGTEDLVGELSATGKYPVAVDLTARLPPAHRAMGWRAVKVVVPGLQALRMNEQHHFTWNHARIDVAGGAVCRFPHPLI